MKTHFLHFTPSISIAILGSLLMVARDGICAQEEQPPHVQLTSEAWDAFNSGAFERAIAKADKCVEKFAEMAEKEQVKLEKDKLPPPPKGAVSDAEKKAVLERGPLNDVATCYYIKGRALEALKRKTDAKRAYESAKRLTYARCWDPKGWFWSPSEEASDRLSGLQQ